MEKSQMNRGKNLLTRRQFFDQSKSKFGRTEVGRLNFPGAEFSPLQRNTSEQISENFVLIFSSGIAGMTVRWGESKRVQRLVMREVFAWKDPRLADHFDALFLAVAERSIFSGSRGGEVVAWLTKKIDGSGGGSFRADAEN